jgi:hypothetical protein
MSEGDILWRRYAGVCSPGYITFRKIAPFTSKGYVFYSRTTKWQSDGGSEPEHSPKLSCPVCKVLLREALDSRLARFFQKIRLPKMVQ